MRFVTSKVRMLIKAGLFVVPSLLAASIATATPMAAGATPHAQQARAARPHADVRQLSTLLRRLADHGPSHRLLATDLRPHLQRRTGHPLADDDAAIQDDAPAASTDERVTPSLEPLEILPCSGSPLPSDRLVTRRAPRGPPTAG